MTEDDFKDWRANQITDAFLKWIEQTVHDAEHAWGSILTSHLTGEQMLAKRAALAERALLATEIINVSYEDLYEEQMDTGVPMPSGDRPG